MADITRADVATLIQEEYSNVFLDAAGDSEGSAAIRAFGTVPLGTKITNAPVLTTLPEASWVSESSTAPAGVKPTSKAVWGNKKFVVEELAVIIPIHEDVLEDMTEDGLQNLSVLGGRAIGKKLDEAILFGQDKPTTWIDLDLLAAATAAGNVFQISATPGADDLAGSIFQAAGAVADSGANPTTILSSAGLRFRLANLRASDGTAILSRTLGGDGTFSDDIAGLRASFVDNGAWDAALATAIVADRTRVKIGQRSDIQVKFLDQATVGGINLAERDMVALRFKARYAYALGNTITGAGTNAEPVGAVTPAA
ncbi:phage major capsid protein [Microbacterium maritypicum]|uniref:Phage major capsid protein n=2 Tax=Microbacterium maritypicum TaxID=33918 RepID=A0ACD4B8W9_MICMQ|nr:phage major capsid protein [Microbacterium liquefaciens]UTT53804.1 phage major capsid protein [Microbacterium liquefaciens]UTT53870.1 phage major capsid protein [Microbacterium liquefaciens]